MIMKPDKARPAQPVKNPVKIPDRHDPYERDPGAGKPEDERINEAAEQEAREEEGVSSLGDGSMPTGTQPGQMSRGSFGTDRSTGAGAYMDRSVGEHSNAPVAQPGEDRDREPDPAEKGF